MILDGARTSYAIQVATNGATTIRDIGAGDATVGQTVTVTGESYILFNGTHISLTAPSSVAAMTTPPGSTTPVLNYPNDLYFVLNPANAQLAQFYSALLPWEPQPALGGLDYWASRLAAGMPLTAIAQSFINTPYFQQTFGDPGTTHAQHLAFIELLYSHILGMNLDATNGGVLYWTNAMDTNPLMDGAHAVISFTNATATMSTINAVSGAAAGTGTGWLVNFGTTGGYADPGLQESAASVVSQSSTFINTSLIDPTTIANASISTAGVDILGPTTGNSSAPGSIWLNANAPGTAVNLSASFTQLTANSSSNSIHDGPGTDTITINGSANNVITVGGATTDALNLSTGTSTYVFGFSPGHGSILSVRGRSTAPACRC